jgi:hypothetical protein
VVSDCPLKNGTALPQRPRAELVVRAGCQQRSKEISKEISKEFPKNFQGNFQENCEGRTGDILFEIAAGELEPAMRQRVFSLPIS